MKQKPHGLADNTKPEPFNITVNQAVHLGPMSRSEVYRAAGRGDLILRKLGTRTLIDYQSFKRFLANLPRVAGSTDLPEQEV